MIYLHMSALFALGWTALCWRGMGQKSGNRGAGYLPFLIFGGALVIRVALACVGRGFNADINCFAAWAGRMWTVGPGEFYSPEVFTDYPPGFLFYLYLVGGLCDRLGIAYLSGPQLFLIKLPALLCDMACGWLIYREADRRAGRRKACFLAAMYLYQPAVILNSALWGQVDSILTLAAVGMCLLLMKGKLPAAYLVFGMGVLLKPQMLIFTPVLLAGILDQVFLKDFSWKKLAYHFSRGMGAIAGVLLLCLPFGPDQVLRQYLATLAEYPYAAVNACNFWGLLGKNWVTQDEKFLFLSCRSWGAIVIVGIVFFSFWISLRRREDLGKYPLIAAFIVVTMFAFSVRMHERYLYPALALLLLAYLYCPEKGLYLCCGGFALLNFYNMADVLYFYDPADYDRRSPLILIVSAGVVLCAGYFYDMLRRICLNRKKADICRVLRGKGTGRWEDAFSGSGVLRITGTDLLLMSLITLIYAGFALVNLGERQAPATSYDMKAGEEIILEFAEAPASLSYYIAPWQERTFRVEGREHGEGEWQDTRTLLLDHVFTWQEIVLEQPARQLRMVLEEDSASLLEFCFRDGEGRVVTPLNASLYGPLFDEQELCPERSSYRNSMYFDEIYHGRTAYEYLHGLYSYENTHPPLGKILIAVGIALFGMNPFGWRIAGAVCGVLMVPVMYLFGKRLTGSTAAAALAGGLIAFDFMHFTQTRIATIDVFVTFFVMLMYYFMYQYCAGTLQGLPRKANLPPLGLSGICMGLGLACKWTGVYAGLGLAVIFFLVLYWQARGSRGCGQNGVKGFLVRGRETLGFCVVFFVCVPALVYLLSYLPFVDGVNESLLRKMLCSQRNMFDYHSKLNSTHPFASLWYQWPAMDRPVWYYSGVAGETLREGISSFGNPLVWWAGIPALLHMLCRVFRRRDGRALFLVTAYAAQYLPWMFVSRLTFIYHYFPSVPFVALMVAYSLQCLAERARPALGPRGKFLFPSCALLYGLAAFALFLLFYPVLSGAPVEIGYVDRWLRWREGWVLIAD